ncbi:MAG: group III truncated hemoglobin [Bacteroidetes bacterium]|nr:group III truncated hemoglobin [Bacteroidota bacterium]
MKPDITSRTEIKQLVDQFYQKVRQDDLIGPIFNERIQPEAWPPHLEKMYSFWSMVLLGEMGYRGHPFAKHAPLPIDHQHFSRWLELFEETVNEHFEGKIADLAVLRSKSIGGVFESKLEHLRSTGHFPLIDS